MTPTEIDFDHPTGAATDPELFGAVLAHFRAYAKRIALNALSYKEKRGGKKHYDADDIVQDAMLAAVRRIKSYDPARGAFRSWLAWHVKEACHAIFKADERHDRRCKKVESLPVAREEFFESLPDTRTRGPLAAAEANDFWAVIGAGVTDKQREVLILRFRCGLERPQIARMIGIAESNVKERENRAKETLRARCGHFASVG